ncbi:unnamed protein product [Amoebophrya sp. A25]|nr:unnamed protein product [Amoebophrya sp. A25]|eukprot:GSA25T00009550001.1
MDIEKEPDDFLEPWPLHDRKGRDNFIYYSSIIVLMLATSLIVDVVSFAQDISESLWSGY